MFGHRIDDELEIRLFVQQHADELFALTDSNREYLREWLAWVDDTRGVEDIKRFIKMGLDQFAANEGFHAGLWYKGRMAGSIGCHKVNWQDRKVEIGYWLAADYQGRGLVTKACRALVGYLFNDLGLNRVEIHCAAGNKKSRAIAERLGFVEEGTLRQAQLLYDRFHDLVIYAMLKEGSRI